jgi:vacuolar-type H+-ATPase subunit E/Vma4
MEELQSTEILDREILEDARKKASRILKSADETAAAGGAVWEKKTNEALAELRDRYAATGEKTSVEIMARLPLDKKRAKSEIIEKLLLSAAEDWVLGLGRERLLSLLEQTMRRYVTECPEILEEESAGVTLHNLDIRDAEPLMRRILPGLKMEIREAPAAHHYPEIIVDAKPVRLISSLKVLLDTLLHDRREELVSALIGEQGESA